MDLAKAHIIALEHLIEKRNQDNYSVYNIGTGKGSSVLEVIECFVKNTGVKLNYVIGKRRAGDVESAYADNTKAKEELKWTPKYSLDDAILSAWKWERKIRNI